MAIKYGKGIRGFLGRIPTSNYQYTPMPFNEMLAMGQLADSKANQNIKLQSQVNQLYNQPLLQKDREIYDIKSQEFGTRMGDALEKAGGSLSNGNLSRTLTQEYYDIIGDRGYANAVNAFKQHQDYQKMIMSNVKDRDLVGSYVNQSLNNYNNSEQGSLYTPMMNFSTLSEAQFDSNLNTVANQMKAKRLKQLQSDGNQQYTIETVQLDPENVAKALRQHVGANSSLLSYASDKANALGMDPNMWVESKIIPIANRKLRNDFIQSKSTEISGASDSEGLGYGYVGESIDSGISTILTGKDDPAGSINNLNIAYRDGTMGLEDYTARISLYEHALLASGQSPESVDALMSGDPKTYVEDINAFINNIIEDEQGNFTVSKQDYLGNNFSVSKKSKEAAIQGIENYFFDIPEEERRTFNNLKKRGYGVVSQRILRDPFKQNIGKDITISDEVTAYLDDYMETQASTLNPQYMQYSATKGESAAAIKSFNDKISRLEGSFTPTPKYENTKLDGLNITDIGKRIYYDYNLNQPMVYVAGKNGNDQKIVGRVPLNQIDQTNQGLKVKAFYDSNSARELSRLIYPGQYIAADMNKPNSSLTKFAKQKLDKAGYGTENYTLGFRINPNDKKFEVILMDRNNNTVLGLLPISGDGGKTTKGTTFTLLAETIDKQIKQQ